MNDPMQTVTTSAGEFAECVACMAKMHRGDNLGHWPEIRALLNEFCGYTLAEDEVLLLEISGALYYIADIGLRMLSPRELYNAVSKAALDLAADAWKRAPGKRVAYLSAEFLVGRLVYANLLNMGRLGEVQQMLLDCGIDGRLPVVLLFGTFVVLAVEHGGRSVTRWIREQVWPLRWTLYYAAAAAILFFAAFGQSAFIYQQY